MRLALLVCLLSGAPAVAQDPAAHGFGAGESALAESELDDLVALYRHFHRHPELSFQEVETSKRVAAELLAAGCTVTENFGGYGVVGIMSNGDGPRVMVRGDMDGLPITEATGLPYASAVEAELGAGQRVGVMHACGHDLHMTNLIGVARYFGAHRDRWRGTLMYIGQPAEERSGGALAMLRARLFEKFGRPDCALALHVSPELPTGVIGYRAGPALANVDSVDIIMRGRGGHGSAPHTTIDPIVQAAQLVLDLQTIVSREIDPLEPAVITVGSIHGGSKHNIIGAECHLQLTVRSYSDEVREHLTEAIVRKAMAVAAGARAPDPVVKVSEGTPALVNDTDLVERVVPVLRNALGEAGVVEVPPRMAAEDFGRFGRAGVPIFMFWLGTIAPERLAQRAAAEQPPLSLHSPYYYPDARQSLHTGITAMVAAILDLMAPR